MSTTLKISILFASIALSTVACGKKEDAPAGGATSAATLTNAAAKLGACNKVKNVGKCTEYDLSKDTLGLSKGGCEATDGKWETNACPTEKVFAACQTSESKIIYYAGTTDPNSALTMDDEFAKIDCEMMSGKLTVTGKAADIAGAGAKPAAGGAAAGGAAKKPAAAPTTPGKKK